MTHVCTIDGKPGAVEGRLAAVVAQETWRQIHGSQVLIQTQEGAAGSYNLLGAWATRTLYYYSSGYSQEQWTVYKLDPSQDENISALFMSL